MTDHKIRIFFSSSFIEKAAVCDVNRFSFKFIMRNGSVKSKKNVRFDAVDFLKKVF